MPDGGAVDRGEHRLGHLADRLHDRVVALGERPVDVRAPVRRGLATADVLEIRARGEGATGAGDHHGAHRVVLGGVAQRGEQVRPELRVPCVQRLRSVQLDRAGAVGHAHVDRLKLDVRLAWPFRVLMGLLSSCVLQTAAPVAPWTPSGSR